jgi:hypothetical protein
MSRHQAVPPDLVPVLSRGKHRNARKGACFMEMASVLAGERWSDHPKCTHPLLAELARLVNDCTADANRQQLAVLIPDVIGLTSEDLRVDARIALRCALTALPVASAERQNVLAVSVLTADHVLAGLEGRAADGLEERSRRALHATPKAADWADAFVRRAGISAKGFRRHAAPNTVRGAVHAIAEACVPDPDTILHGLLVDSIREVAALCAAEAAPATGRPAARTEV